MNKSCFVYLGMLMALLPASAHAANFEFTLATCNVLHESYYIGFAKSNPVMPFPQRTAAFQKAVTDNEFKNADIYCFQEWPGSAAAPTTAFSDILNAALPESGKNYPQLRPHDSTPEDTTSLRYNANKFTLIQSESNYKIFQDPKKRPNPYPKNTKSIVYAVLESKIEKQIVIVINVHVPFSLPKTGADINPSYKASLLEIKQIIGALRAKKYKNPIWILCGDFNFDTWDAKNNIINQYDYNLLKNTLFQANPEKIEKLPISSNAEIAGDKPTNFGSSVTKKYEFNDYIFYSDNVTAQFSMFPSDPEKFIRHAQTDADLKARNGAFFDKDYFSDHAIIRATFTKKADVPGGEGDGGGGEFDDAALKQSLNDLTNSLNSLTESLGKAA